MHVVFGAGQVGLPLIERLVATGQTVRVVRQRAIPVPGAEVVSGDARDPAFCARSARGATTVYHCLNTDYSAGAWSRALPTLQQNLVRAAGSAGARLVVLENLYMLGHPPGPIDDESRIAPQSEKGRIRAELTEALFAAHRRGEVQVVSGRAAHLFGPGVTQSVIGAALYQRVLRGRSAQAFGDLESRHSFAFAPDIATALVHLGTAAHDECGRAHVLPVMPPLPTRLFLAELLRHLQCDVPITRVPRPALRLAALFVPIVRELVEMHYEWEREYVVDDSRFRTRFAFEPTPLASALEATARWARAFFTAT